MDLAEPGPGRLVERGLAHLLEQLLDHRADAHDLGRLLDHVRQRVARVVLVARARPRRPRPRVSASSLPMWSSASGRPSGPITDDVFVVRVCHMLPSCRYVPRRAQGEAAAAFLLR